MSEESDTARQAPGPAQLGEAGEHPLSVLLFSWMRSRLFYRLLMAGLAGAGVLLIALDAVLIRRDSIRLDTLPGFFGVFGFLSFAMAVLSSWPLGRLLRRREDYYDTSSGEAGRDR